jgi:hypothetical protein
MAVYPEASPRQQSHDELKSQILFVADVSSSEELKGNEIHVILEVGHDEALLGRPIIPFCLTLAIFSTK